MSDSTLATAPEKRPQIAVDGGGVNIRSFDEMARFSQAIVNSGLAPKSFQTPEAVMVAIQAGMEIGLPPMQALQGIAVINGRPTLWGDAALAVVTAHPAFQDIDETFEGTKEEAKAVCRVTRKNRAPVVRGFSVADAKRAGLWGKSGPWTQYPKRMLQMRARAFAIRDAFPDALRGCGIREEVSDHPSRPVNEPRKVTGIVLPDDPEPEPEPLALESGPEEKRDAEGNIIW